MKNAKRQAFFLYFLIAIGLSAQSQSDSLSLLLKIQGQASTFLLFNPDNSLELYSSARYIPQVNLEAQLPKKNLLDLEASANIFGTLGVSPFDESKSNGGIRPYRAWVRYSRPQFELRAGLQKINFGSASILRPLMWFDQIDPRDPLQLTDGVWGALGRYYFLNNANIWLWGLYGNDNRRGFDAVPSDPKTPEFGGRFQFPTSRGEAAITYHHREADVSGLNGFGFEKTPEHRFAVDGKWDLTIGLWVEATWLYKTENVGLLTNQNLINFGTDYTFALGNGLHVVAEQLIIGAAEKPFGFEKKNTLTAVFATYPLGLFDNLGAIFYYDWTNEKIYNTLQWQHIFSKWTLNVLAFWNPKINQLPQQNFQENLFGGKGVQLLAVYNH